MRHLNQPIAASIAQENGARLATVHTLLRGIAPDLRGTNRWRYQRQLSGGVQEFIEAISFEHYLTTQRLIPIEDAHRILSPDGVPGDKKSKEPYPNSSETRTEASPGSTITTAPTGGAAADTTLALDIHLIEDDYLLGLFDLVGELMRWCITTMATTGSIPGSSPAPALAPTPTHPSHSPQQQQPPKQQRNMVADLRSLRTSFEALDTHGAPQQLHRDAEKKMEVMRACVEKVEAALYGMMVRGRERPSGWVPDEMGDGGREEGGEGC